VTEPLLYRIHYRRARGNFGFERDEDGYFVASVPTLRGRHTLAKSLDVLMKRIREAIELCLEVEKPAATEFIGVQRVAVNS
jgi:predicted RNase H-like HicB family nuclease